MIENRKDEHVRLALAQVDLAPASDFDLVSLEHDSIPNLKVDDIDLTTSIAGIDLVSPLFINAMTGGSDKTKGINEKLAEVARLVNIPIASGSLSSALKNPDNEASFSILRKTNPDGIIFANVGAEYDLSAAQKAVDILSANALQIHVNVIQEVVMPEGDRDFTSWNTNIAEIAKSLSVPLIVKEVGFGMSSASIKKLINLGVKTIDLSGYGGTNFAKIENARREDFDMSYLENMGISTVQSLINAKDYLSEVEIIASGGIRNPLDVIKSLAMGASAVGMSSFVLSNVEKHGVNKTVEILNAWNYQLKLIMTLLGVKNIKELQKIKVNIKL
ncbi:MAG: type 2 isopentenyl-diphosphate Delta-isomerase [Erysipelothrix sp.]|nr:type 2 isopentenyl-diphosphate Delta-isomerase [Erysipelothrix sp.]